MESHLVENAVSDWYESATVYIISMQIIAPLLSLFTQGILSAFFPPIFQSH